MFDDGSSRAAFERYPADGPDVFTDEAALLEACSIPVHVIDGEPDNIKVTLPADLARAAAVLQVSRGRMRTGSATTAIRRPGAPLVLGGVRIEGAPWLHGHSDGDVALHAVCDALLAQRVLATSAASSRRSRDAGRHRQHRPPGGCRWRVGAAGLRPASVDLTIVAGRPKLGSRLDAMRDVLAAALGPTRPASTSRRRPGTSMAWRALAGASRARHRGAGGGPMTIQLHDTLSDDVRPFAPLDGARARIYSCGPTVYGPAHIGNFR